MQNFNLLLFFSLLALVLSARPCLKNGAGCKSDGSKGLCCSGFCYQERGQNSGKCQSRGVLRALTAAPEVEDEVVDSEGANCLKNGANCKSDGSKGNCCSGFCYQEMGQSTGKCKNRALQLLDSVAILEADWEVDSNGAKCLKNGAKCKADGSKGNCCSGFCYQQQGQNSGKCQNRALDKLTGIVPSAAQVEVVDANCLKNGAKCKADGSKGNCCSGFCYQQQGQNSGKCQNRALDELTATVPSVAQIEVVDANCLKNGATCKSDGSKGNCCSGFCYQEMGQNSGKCKKR